MKKTIAVLCLTVLVAPIAIAAQPDPYYVCLDQEAKVEVKRALQKRPLIEVERDLTSIRDLAFKTCTARYPSHPADLSYAHTITMHVLLPLMHADYEKRLKEKQEKDAQQEAANDAKGKVAAGAYRDCVFASIKMLAVISTEPAEDVKKAALAACQDKREAILHIDIENGHGHLWKGVLDELDKRMEGQLILEIIKARALRRASPPHTEQTENGS